MLIGLATPESSLIVHMGSSTISVRRDDGLHFTSNVVSFCQHEKLYYNLQVQGEILVYNVLQMWLLLINMRSSTTSALKETRHIGIFRAYCSLLTWKPIKTYICTLGSNFILWPLASFSIFYPFLAIAVLAFHMNAQLLLIQAMDMRHFKQW